MKRQPRACVRTLNCHREIVVAHQKPAEKAPYTIFARSRGTKQRKNPVTGDFGDFS